MTDRPLPPSRMPPAEDGLHNRGEPPAPAPAGPDGPGRAWSGAGEHPLVTIPFTAFIDGRKFLGQGLSLVEAHVTGLADPALEGQERLVRLSFEFQGFSVSLNPKMRIERLSSRQLVLHFAEPAGPHLPQLRHILNEFIAGDLTAIGSVIRAGTLGGAAGGGAGTVRRGFGRRLVSAAGTLLTLAAMLALVGLAWLLIENRLLVTDFASPGRVVEEGRTLRAVADGQIAFLDTGAAPGDVVLAIAATSGETLSLAMPCDCTVRTIGVAEGSTVLSGEPVLRLAEPGAATVIEAEVPARDALAVEAAGGAQFRVPGGAWHEAALLTDAFPVEGDDGLVPLRFAPARPLDPALSGRLVEMRLVGEPDFVLSRYTDRLADLTRSGASVVSGNVASWSDRFSQIFEE